MGGLPPDYDYVGLMEYDKAKQELTPPVSLYFPEHVPALFGQYGKRALLTKQKQYANTVNTRCDSPDVSERYRTIVHLIRTHGKGLEQEALLVRG